MADSGDLQNAQAGPIEQFLKRSAVYREFLEESDAELAESAGDPNTTGFSATPDGGKLSVDLEIERARFAMTLDVSEQARASATLVFPSRISRLDLGDLHSCVRRVIEATYPRRGLTPQAAIIGNGSELRLDLAKYWDGAVYERAIADPSVSAVVYYVQIPQPVPAVRFLEQGPTSPDFMYGFLPDGSHSREFLTVSYLQARHIGAELTGVLLSRHKDYADDDLTAAAERLAQQIRDGCKAHAPRPLF